MTTQKFAKLFEDEKYGQILVMRDTDEDGEPVVKFIAQPPGLGICALAVAFDEEDHAQSMFDKVDHEHARAGVAELWDFGGAIQ